MTDFLGSAWTALNNDSALLERVDTSNRDQVALNSPLPVGELAFDAVAAASLSAAAFALGTSNEVAAVELDPARIATAYTSDRHFRQNGEPANPWAPLSGFWQAADGWLRTHANYPHHRERLLAALGLADSATADDLRKTIAGLSALDIENRVTASGGIAVAVRGEAEWREHPQSVAIAELPLLEVISLGEAAPRTLAASGGVDRSRPLAGIRVLDFTRVIAGPVATRTLALWGADVLRIDSPKLLEPEWQHLDTGAGKRSTLLDLGNSSDRAILDDLLDEADVVVTGYRPGALESKGLEPRQLADKHPGLVVARLSAWGRTGPWSDRRGFDSIVQAASGIALISSADGQKPGALPAQALDHSAGYLLAAGITSLLARQAEEGGSWLVETSLARIAHELLTADRPAEVGTLSAPEPTMFETESRNGTVTLTLPAPAFEGSAARWATAGGSWGADRPKFKRR